MGFFSWMTSDTNESIPSTYSNRDTFPVFVLCPDGSVICEDEYEGYGVFGGKDIYQLVAEWNCPEKCNGDVDHDRSIGISIGCYDKQNAELKFPIKIVKDVVPYENAKYSIGCPDQGFFYPE